MIGVLHKSLLVEKRTTWIRPMLLNGWWGSVFSFHKCDNCAKQSGVLSVNAFQSSALMLIYTPIRSETCMENTYLNHNQYFKNKKNISFCKCKLAFLFGGKKVVRHHHLDSIQKLLHSYVVYFLVRLIIHKWALLSRLNLIPGKTSTKFLWCTKKSLYEPKVLTLSIGPLWPVSTSSQFRSPVDVFLHIYKMLPSTSKVVDAIYVFYLCRHTFILIYTLHIWFVASITWVLLEFGFEYHLPFPDELAPGQVLVLVGPLQLLKSINDAGWFMDTIWSGLCNTIF